jgi:phosphate-selective porin OprO/OprP
MKPTRNALLAATALAAVGFATVAGQTQAQTQEQMLRRMEALERELATLKNQVKTQEEAQKQQKPQEPLVKMQGGRPVFTTPDGNFSIGLTGRIHFDMGYYFQDNAPAQPDPRTVSDFNDGANFRRARLGVTGDLFKDFEYGIVLDVGGSPDGSTVLDEAFLAFKGLKPLTFQIGAFKPPLTMEDSTSSNEITFIERASAVNVATSQTAGTARNAVGVKANGQQWFAAAFLTGSTPGVEVDDEAVGATLRAAGRPLMEKDYNLHIGAWGTELFRPPQTAGAVQTLTLQDRPELRVDSNRLVSTGALPADGFAAWGLEAAGNYKSFSLQGEYMKFYLDQDNGPNPTALRPSLDFDGYYVAASWVLTGESRTYSSSRAAYGSPRPAKPFSLSAGTWGAFELAYRYSVLNLDDENPATGIALSTTGGARGGEQTIHTVGLNWYLNNHIRLMFNYLHVDVDRLNAAGTVQVGQDYDAVALRTQVNW